MVKQEVHCVEVVGFFDSPWMPNVVTGEGLRSLNNWFVDNRGLSWHWGS